MISWHEEVSGAQSWSHKFISTSRSSSPTLGRHWAAAQAVRDGDQRQRPPSQASALTALT
jgi:hypothetical protein